MQFAVSVHRAAEDYLEAMLMMKEQHGYVRSIDVAEHLGVTKPSVTYATKQLKQNGLKAAWRSRTGSIPGTRR